MPPGEYRLEAYGDKLNFVHKPITVKPGDKALALDALELPAKKIALMEGKPAPELRGVLGWKNAPVKLADLKGKIVLLDFWGYWCDPCLRRMPELLDLEEKFRDKGLALVGVHLDQDDGVDTATKLDEKLVGARNNVWKGKDLLFPIALTAGLSQAASDYGIDNSPITVMIDRKGLIVGQFYTNIKASREQLDKLLKEK